MVMLLALIPLSAAQEAYNPPKPPGPGWFGESGRVEGDLGDGDELRGKRGSMIQAVPIELMGGLSGTVQVYSSIDGSTYTLTSPGGNEIVMDPSTLGKGGFTRISLAEAGTWTLSIHANRKKTGNFNVNWSFFGPEAPPDAGAGLCEALDYLTAQAHIDFDDMRALSPQQLSAMLPGLGAPELHATELRIDLPAGSTEVAQQSYDQAADLLAPCRAGFTVIDKGWVEYSVGGSGYRSRKLIYAERDETPRGQVSLGWSDFGASQSVRLSIYTQNQPLP